MKNTIMKNTILKTVSLILFSTYLISCEKIEVEPSQEPTPAPTSFTIEQGQYNQIGVRYPNINDTLWGLVLNNPVSDSIKINKLLVNNTASSGSSSDVNLKLRFGHVNPDTLSNINFNGVMTLGFDGEVNFQLVNDWQTQVEWGDNGLYKFREVDAISEFNGCIVIDENHIDFSTGDYVNHSIEGLFYGDNRHFILEDTEGVQFILEKEF